MHCKTDGVENACCEFDVQNPSSYVSFIDWGAGTFQCICNFKRLGIEDSIIQRAKELVSAENTKFEDVVRSLEETRQKLEEEKKRKQKHCGCRR